MFLVIECRWGAVDGRRKGSQCCPAARFPEGERVRSSCSDTLHELQLLQAARSGAEVSAPAVVDLNVDVSPPVRVRRR